MSINRDELKRMIDLITDQELAEVFDFIGYLQLKKEREALQNMLKASETSMDFWENSVDDEIWNNA
jgi:hypothetical protein